MVNKDRESYVLLANQGCFILARIFSMNHRQQPASQPAKPNSLAEALKKPTSPEEEDAFIPREETKEAEEEEEALRKPNLVEAAGQ